jgi:hypothetical protein
MTLFALSLACGILELWALLTMWGVTAGPINAVPVLALLGSLVLLLVAAPLALFLSRIGAIIGLVGALLAITWPVAIVLQERRGDSLLLAIPAASVLVAAIWRLRRTRGTPWWALVTVPSLWLRVALSTVPVIAFISLFNALPVLALLTAGSP